MSSGSRSPSLFPLISSRRSSISSSYNCGRRESNINWRNATKTKSFSRDDQLQHYAESSFSVAVRLTKNCHSFVKRSDDVNTKENLCNDKEKHEKDDEQHFEVGSENSNRFENDGTATQFKLNGVDQRSFSPRRYHRPIRFRKLSYLADAARAGDTAQSTSVQEKTLSKNNLENCNQHYSTVHKINFFPPICEGTKLQNEKNFKTSNLSNTVVTKNSSADRQLQTRSNSQTSFSAPKVFCNKYIGSTSAPTNIKPRKKYSFKRSFSTPDRPPSCNGNATLHSAHRNRSSCRSMSASTGRFSEVDDVFSDGSSGFHRK